ncbi:MAG: thiolase family protein, partial [Rhodospirillales bacterium]|nr:thiolase family protein [Rhodospirillales bacterium]
MPKNYLVNRDIAIVAYGETKIERRSGKTTFEFAADAMEQILTRTGLTPADIDGFATNVSHSESANQYATTYMCDALGLTPRYMQVSDHGGGAGLACISRAAMAIQSGMCETVLVIGADAPTSYWEGKNLGYRPEFWDPTGIQGPPGAFGLLMHRYMEQYDLQFEALGKLAVAQREGAVVNENALPSLRKPITIDDYMNSRMVTSPLRLLDSVMFADGGNGVLMMSTERARALGYEKFVHPIAYSEIVNFNGREAQPDITETGFSVVGPDALDKAGMAASDIRMFHPYDDFLIAVMLQLEQIGFCGRGEGSEFLLGTDVTWRGSLPINTGGGQISCGQVGLASGLTNLVEAVRQMFGEAGERQVADPSNAMVTGIG